MWTDGGGTNTPGKAAGRVEDKDKDKDEDADHLQAGRFIVDVGSKKAPLAVAAPGMH